MTIDSLDADYNQLVASFQGSRPTLSQRTEREASSALRLARIAIDEAKRKRRYVLNYKRDIDAAERQLARCRELLNTEAVSQ